MVVYELKYEQKIPSTLENVWDFISSPLNLKKITPDHMNVMVTSSMFKEKMYPGMIISYKISPFWGIKLKWVTEITHVKEKEYFIDEQRIGPYAMWHHQHKIEKTNDGVLMTDIVSYQPPLKFLGAIANSLIIEKQLNEIFDFRKKALEKIFGKIE